MPGCGAPSGQAGVALEPGFVRQGEGGTGLWEEERSRCIQESSGPPRREARTGKRAAY